MNIKFYLVILVLVAASCGGKKQPKAQITTDLTVPELQSDVALNLLESKDEKTFVGSIIVWDKNISQDTLVSLMGYSRSYNQVLVEQFSFEDENIAPIRKEISNNREKYKELVAEKNFDLYANRFAIARGWFEAQIARPELNLDEDDLRQAREAFSGFCEAKLWEQTLNSEFVQARYKIRPTPLALCQDIYDVRGLLDVNVDACADAKDEESGKGYFKCYWSEGVTKTKLYARLLNERASELSAISVDTLERELADPTLGLRIKDKILKQMPSVQIGGQQYNFSFTGQARPNQADATLLTAPVAMVRDQFIKSLLTRPVPASFADALSLVSLNRRDRIVNVDQSLRAVDSLRENIRLFADQVNENLINGPQRVGYDLNSNRGNADWSAFAEIVDATVPEIDEELVTLDEEIVKLEKNLQKNNLLGGSLFEAGGYTCEDQPENLICKTEQAFKDQVLAVTQDGVGEAMLSNVQLILQPKSDEFYAVGLQFDYDDPNVPTIYACFSLKTGELVKSKKCSIETEDKLQGSLDLQSGKISLGFPLSNPATMGWSHKDKIVGEINHKFNLLDEAELQGSGFEFEVYPNRLGDTLNIFTGSAKITTLDGEHSASVNFVEKR